jgi:hypothetical protein
MMTKPPLQKILQEILHTDNESQEHHEKAGKKVKSNIDLATHNQILNQQRKLHDRDHHIRINTNTEC